MGVKVSIFTVWLLSLTFIQGCVMWGSSSEPESTVRSGYKENRDILLGADKNEVLDKFGLPAFHYRSINGKKEYYIYQDNLKVNYYGFALFLYLPYYESNEKVEGVDCLMIVFEDELVIDLRIKTLTIKEKDLIGCASKYFTDKENNSIEVGGMNIDGKSRRWKRVSG